MKIETSKQYYDYNWRLHDPYSMQKCYNPSDVNITTHIRATDIHGKAWDLIDNGFRYDNKIYQNSHSRYDLILETFILDKKFEHSRGVIGYETPVSDYSNTIFRLCELEPDFNPETVDTLILPRDKRKWRKDHYIGFVEQNENPFIQMGIRCEMRSRDKMFHWLNKNNPMKSDLYEECCQKQTQIIPLGKKTKNDAIKELNDAIMNELTIIDLDGNTLKMIDVIMRATRR